MENKASIIFIIIAGTIAMIGLSSSIFLFVVAYRRKLREKEDEFRLQLLEKEKVTLEAVIQAQEVEREKIARNIHDEIGPLVALLKMNLSTRSVIEKQDLKKEMEITDMLMANIRSASHDLAPSMLKRNGLAESLCFFISSLKRENAQFINEMEANHPFLKSDRALNVYRIALELLKNIIKYDDPEQLTVRLSAKNERMLLEITHSGEGISNETFQELLGKNGLGLESIRARTLLLKGKVDYRMGNPATVRLEIPVHG